MNLTAKVKLLTTLEQHQLLLKTLEQANAACNAISEQAWETKTFRQYPLHQLVYYDVRKQFGLAAQVVIRCIAKVNDAYKKDRKRSRTFKPHGSIPYDSRILKWNLEGPSVSIWAIGGRLTIPFAAGQRQLELLQGQKGESDLVYVNGIFYLFATCHVDEAKPVDVENVLGIDLGIANIAVDSEGQMHSGSHVKSLRYRHRRLRQRLQKRQTDSARRKLKKLSGKEHRFAQDVNHCISKQLVQKAKRTRSAIALEDLKGIRKRVRATRQQRAVLHSWAFYDLQQKIAYKAQLTGIPVIFVNPAYTSQTCPVCDCVDKRNRTNQKTFSCIQCDYAAHADYVAALNIQSRGAVNHPNVGTTLAA